MLEIESFPEEFGNQQPMDFSPYLLSASPPSSSFDLFSFSTNQTLNRMNSPINFDSCNFSKPPAFQSLQMAQPGPINSPWGTDQPLKPIICRSESCSDSEGDSGSESSSSLSSCSPVRRTKKRVTFADHKGLALAQVKLLKETPDEPPSLSPTLISALTKGLQADVTLKPPMHICFPQPASDYMAFREKLNRNLVSLENVILRDYSVEGTIKVKNITFEKKVFVRLSVDEWVSHEDHSSIYVKGLGLGYAEPYDTFSFSLNIPTDFDTSKRLQFAVCFEENDNQHWDNNGGSNYCIVSELYKENAVSLRPNPDFEKYLPEKKTEAWSEFSVWRDVGSNSPYY